MICATNSNSKFENGQVTDYKPLDVDLSELAPENVINLLFPLTVEGVKDGDGNISGFRLTSLCIFKFEFN